MLSFFFFLFPFSFSLLELSYAWTGVILHITPELSYICSESNILGKY